MFKHQSALLHPLLSVSLAIAISAAAFGAGAGKMSGGTSFSVVVKPDGKAWAWGTNSDGQLGNGSNEESHVPVQVGADVWAGMSVKTVASGDAHSLAIVDNGTGKLSLYAWGDNPQGQIGNGTTNAVVSPVLIEVWAGVGMELDAVACGANHSLVLFKSATGQTQVWAWGKNDRGELGLGHNNSPVTMPERIKTLDSVNITQIAAGGDFSVALGGGSVYTWGDNLRGQLGRIPSISFQMTPDAISDLPGVQAIVAGSSFCFAWKQDDVSKTQTVWAWGANTEGQLCLGPDELNDEPAPTKVALLPEKGVILGIQAGAGHAIAMIENGDANQVYAWGDNSYQQVSSGSLSRSPAPLPVAGGFTAIGVRYIGVGTDHSLVTDSNGRVWTWGAWLGQAAVYDLTPVEQCPASLVVSADPSMAGKVEVQGATVFDEQVTVAATSDTGYSFTGWSGSAVDAGLVQANSPNPVTFRIDRDCVLVASFAQNCELTVSTKDNNGTTTPAPGQYSYAYGTDVPIEAKPNANYKFARWEGSAVDAGKVTESVPGSGKATVKMDDNYAVTAVFEPLTPIVDPALKDAIKQTLNLTTDPNVFDLGAADFTRLEARGKGIKDLAGLEYATNLKYLYLENNQITHIDELSSLQNLERLYLSNNSILDSSAFDVIPNLDNLQYVLLDNTNDTIQDLPGAWLDKEKLKKLRVLDVRGNSGLRKSDTWVAAVKAKCKGNGGSLLVDN